MRFMKSLAAALALTVGVAAFAGPASADHRWRHHRHHGGNAAAAGIVGFGVGALLGSALAQPRYYEPRYYEPRYYEPAPIYVEPAPVYVTPGRVYSYEAWSPEWYEYCGSRYRSFDERTGYFVGYDQRRHFCR